MSSKVYESYVHTHVSIEHPDKVALADVSQAWEGLHAIVHHTGGYVWIYGSYAYPSDHAEIKQVGDGRDNGFDQAGGCIYSVPAAWCTYYDDKEAETIEAMIDADERLLSYAH